MVARCLAGTILASTAQAGTLDTIRAWMARSWNMLDRYPLLEAAVIIVAAFIVAKVFDLALCRGVRRLTARTTGDLDDRIVDDLHTPIFLTIFFLGLTIATARLNIHDALTFGVIRILKTITLLVWIRAAMRVSAMILDSLSHSPRFRIVEERTQPLFNLTVKIVVFGIGTWGLLQVWNIDATAWLASAGIVGIAVGFAAKDTLANLFSGFFILVDAPYKIGDFVNLDSGDRGRVTHVGMRSTRILTRDDIEVTLPNAVIANSKITNESGGPHKKERIRIPVGVAYGSDLDDVCKVLVGAAIDHPEVCEEPSPRVRMRSFGDSGIDFELLGWIEEPVDRGRIRHDLFMEVYKRLRAASIEIPYPKRDVYVHQVGAAE